MAPGCFMTEKWLVHVNINRAGAGVHHQIRGASGPVVLEGKTFVDALLAGTKELRAFEANLVGGDKLDGITFEKFDDNIF